MAVDEVLVEVVPVPKENPLPEVWAPNAPPLFPPGLIKRTNNQHIRGDGVT